MPLELPTLGEIAAFLTWLASEIASTVAVWIAGTCVGLIVGAFLVRGARLAQASGDKAAMKKAVKEAAKGGKRGKPAPLPIPPEVLANALNHLPRWTRDPDVNRAAWLNQLLDSLWPHLDTAVSATIKESVEPGLRAAVPPPISWIGFEKVTLGPTPPTVGGVKTLGSNSEEVMLELEICLASGLDVVLAAYIFGVRLPVRVHDLQLKAYLRVTFTPLVNELPCLGGLEISLMELPDHLDLGVTLPPGLDLMALPGMHSLLHWALWKFVSPLLVYPAKMTVPIMENSGLEPKATGTVKVTVKGGHNFKRRTKLKGRAKLTAGGAGSPPPGLARQKSSSSLIPTGVTSLVADRYLVQLYTRPSRKVTLASKSSDAPTWDETHYFLTQGEGCLTAVVTTTNFKELGRCEIPLRHLVAPHRAKKIAQLNIPLDDPEPFVAPVPAPRKPETPKPKKAELDAIEREFAGAVKKHATDLAAARARAFQRAVRQTVEPDVPVVSLDLEYIPMGGAGGDAGRVSLMSPGGTAARDSDSEDADAIAEANRLGVLSVFVSRGLNICRENNAKLPTPVAVVSCSEQTYATEAPVEKTKKPLWDESFLFFNVSPAETLSVSVHDKTPDGEFLGEFELDVAEVAKNKELTDGFHLEGVKNAATVFVRTKFTYMS